MRQGQPYLPHQSDSVAITIRGSGLSWGWGQGWGLGSGSKAREGPGRGGVRQAGQAHSSKWDLGPGLQGKIGLKPTTSQAYIGLTQTQVVNRLRICLGAEWKPA